MSTEIMAANTGTIAQFGTNNPAVSAFLQATFATEALGLRYAAAQEAGLQAGPNVAPESGRGIV